MPLQLVSQIGELNCVVLIQPAIGKQRHSISGPSISLPPRATIFLNKKLNMTRYFRAISRITQGNEEIEVLDHEVRQSRRNQGDLCVTLPKMKKGLKSATHPCLLRLTVFSLEVCECPWRTTSESNDMARLLTISLKVQLLLCITSRRIVSMNKCHIVIFNA